jgi:hypothetical protein
VRVAFRCEATLRVRETKKSIKDQAAHVCRVPCRARVVEEMQQRKKANRRALEASAQLHRPAGALSLPKRRFPPPWSVEETDACFIVRGRGEQALAYGIARTVRSPRAIWSQNSNWAT